MSLDHTGTEAWVKQREDLSALEQSELKLAALEFAVGIAPPLLPKLFPSYVSDWRKAGGKHIGNSSTPPYSPKNFYQVIAARWPDVGPSFRNLPAEFWEQFEDDFIYALEDTKQMSLIKDDLEAFPPEVREFYKFALEFEDDQ